MTTVLASLNQGLHAAFAADEKVYLLGEDVLDPYGGAFKVTRGLSEKYPGRVLTTPISEAGISGVATGMAMRGLRPVVEIMFGDFLTLAADQLVNHAAKFRWMYNRQVSVPLVVRTPMGGRRGYGPTHSQSLEKLFLGVPGLRVLAPSSFGDPGSLLEHTVLTTQEPVLFVEDKLLYLLPLVEADGERDLEILTLAGKDEAPGAIRVRIRQAPQATLTLAAYGHMASLAAEALKRLAYEEELFAELIVLQQLAPSDLGAVFDSVSRTGRLLVAEEGSLRLGWGAEVLAATAEKLGRGLRASGRVAARDLPIPASRALEEAVLPQVEDLVSAALRLAGEWKTG